MLRELNAENYNHLYSILTHIDTAMRQADINVNKLPDVFSTRGWRTAIIKEVCDGDRRLINHFMPVQYDNTLTDEDFKFNQHAFVSDLINQTMRLGNAKPAHKRNIHSVQYLVELLLRDYNFAFIRLPNAHIALRKAIGLSGDEIS